MSNYPLSQDIVAMQKIFSVQTDLIIELSIAHGGSLIPYAPLLGFNAIMEGPKNIHVLASVINRRQHNRLVIEAPHWSQKNHIASYLTL